ncbi:MAG TPA: iron chaperone [Candidatus Scatavimonas merdigallinarum]|uniref:Iron chaperone n=1 Tax=Candidatus Scatavimonas merdigallinarum TaxID=2840914 RepID=A0A9D0ZIC3_9FIRM|nr:iron chaperone [Candidatus Scatavimonas merdigallinarum]
MEVFEKYLLKIKNEAHRSRMREVLAWVKDTFPTLTPKIAWNQPMFTDHGTFIIGFSAAKQHFSVSPEVQGMTAFCDVITKSGYSQTSNLFRIQWEEPVDFPLLERIIWHNIEDKKDCTTFWRK